MKRTLHFAIFFSAFLFLSCGNGNTDKPSGGAKPDSAAKAADIVAADTGNGQVWEGIRKMGENEFGPLVRDASGITVVDFSAEWCGPCRRLEPILASLATQYAGKVRFANIDVDENTNLAVSLAITSIPLIAYYKDGQLVGKEVGLRSEEYLREKIEGLMK